LEIARKLANFSYAEADLLRKAMSKKDTEILLKQKDKFVKGCNANSHSTELALEVYDLIFKFSNYGFVKSHSVAYSVVGFQLAYLKVHYTKYFMAAMLYQSRHSTYSFSLYKREAKRYGVEVLKPDVLKSEDHFAIEGHHIRCSLNAITGIKQSVIDCCVTARQKTTDFIDFVCELAKCKIDKDVVVRLIKSGAFDCFNYNKKTMILNLDDIYQYSELINFSVDGQVSFKFNSIKKPIINNYDEYPHDVLLDFELEVYGYYFEAHPVDKYKMNIECNNSLDVEQFLHRRVTLVLLITKAKEIRTKNNKLMAFFTGSDELGEVSLTLFPGVYANVKGNMQGKVVKVVGQVDKRNSAFNVLVDNIEIL
jgi:DNA polymerase-3 subunit alpha